MQKVFWENPYQTSLTTKVITIDKNEVLLEKTIIYSFSGGQESDKATINGFEVLDSRREGSLIYYTLPDDHNLCSGDTVHIAIDWARRYRLMRLHFAAELILEIITQKFQLEKVGAHIAETKARIDFKFDQNISLFFDGILVDYNQIIQSDIKIQTGFYDIPSQRRYWKIDGFAEVPCGGTHVKSTSEVGFVTLKRTHPGRSLERIEIRLQDNFSFIN